MKGHNNVIFMIVLESRASAQACSLHMEHRHVLGTPEDVILSAQSVMKDHSAMRGALLELREKLHTALEQRDKAREENRKLQTALDDAGGEPSRPPSIYPKQLVSGSTDPPRPFLCRGVEPRQAQRRHKSEGKRTGDRLSESGTRERAAVRSDGGLVTTPSPTPTLHAPLFWLRTASSLAGPQCARGRRERQEGDIGAARGRSAEAGRARRCQQRAP